MKKNLYGILVCMLIAATAAVLSDQRIAADSHDAKRRERSAENRLNFC